MPRKGARESSQTIIWIKQRVLCRDYKLSGHILEKIADNEFSREDIERSITEGDLRKIEKDELGQSVDGNKYCITGPCKSGLGFETVGKIIDWIDGKTYFLITAYRRI